MVANSGGERLPGTIGDEDVHVLLPDAELPY